MMRHELSFVSHDAHFRKEIGHAVLDIGSGKGDPGRSDARGPEGAPSVVGHPQKADLSKTSTGDCYSACTFDSVCASRGSEMTQLSSAPSDLETLRGFVNTLNVEADTDRLATPDGTEAWLAEAGWQGYSALSTEDLTGLRRLREAFRNQLLENAGHHDDNKAASVIAELGRSAPLVVSMGANGAELVPTRDGVWAVIGGLLAIYHTAVLDGTWLRLKACPHDACQWAYYDHSRNGSRRWCTSDGCGNLMAARAYRARDRQTRVAGRE